jgi:hypothetical protein
MTNRHSLLALRFLKQYETSVEAIQPRLNFNI